MSKSIRVYPVEGRYLTDVPHVEHDCEDAFCVESGAFTDQPPPKKAEPIQAPEEPGPSDSTEG
jgi:hypothetical protein